MRQARVRAEVPGPRREFLLATALEVFARRGFEAPTTEELAVACGCDRRTLYRYFPTKEDLFWEAAAQAYAGLAQRFTAAAQTWEDSMASAAGRVRSWAMTYLDFSLEHPNDFRVIMQARERLVASVRQAPKPRTAKTAHAASPMALHDRTVLQTLSGIGGLLESEGVCARGTGETELWEVLGVIIGLIEFHARYRGGGAQFPFGSPDGIRKLITKHVGLAIGPKGTRR
jgi:AcrR family transcriptional regulator